MAKRRPSPEGRISGANDPSPRATPGAAGAVPHAVPDQPAAPGPAGSEEPVTEENITEVEKEAMEKVSKAISALESALATWDAGKDRPPELKEKFQKLRGLHDAFAEWETKMLRETGKETDFYKRVDRLWEFVKICKAYS